MPVDYDLAVIGGTLAGRWAARKAAQMGARVVLIEPRDGITTDAARQRRWMPLLSELTPQHLAICGVDVVLGQPRFESAQPVRLWVGGRSISARTGLLAIAGTFRQYTMPELMGCELKNALALAQGPVPKSLTLVGHQATAIEWAIALQQQGSAVTLRLPTHQLLPSEDVDIQRLVMAQLLAIGVRCIPGPQVFKTGSAIAPKLVPTPSAEPSAVVEPIVLTDAAPPNLSALNLPQLQRQRSQSVPLSVNAYLQTRCPRLYAIGAVLGGEDRLALSLTEASAAVDNALFWNRRSVRYDRIHYSVNGLTPMGRAGLTEQQARRYCDRTVVYQSGAGGTSPYTVDFCKLIVADDQLVGIHLMGAGADRAIALLVTYLRHPLSQLARALRTSAAPVLSDGLGTQIVRAIDQYRQPQWQPEGWRRDWAENWFNWRRSRR